MRLLRLSRPGPIEMAELHRSLASEALSYEAGILDRSAPLDMGHDRLDVVVGSGEGDYERARAAIDRWQPLALGWARAFAGGQRPETGVNVIVTAALLGLHAVVGCRVLSTHEHAGPGGSAYGFTYGSLTSHIEIGEEKFEVALDSAGQVRYRIDVLAKPSRWYARLGLPLVEHYRRRFRADSAAAMQHAVVSG